MFSAGNLAARVRRDANPGRRAYGASRRRPRCPCLAEARPARPRERRRVPWL